MSVLWVAVVLAAGPARGVDGGLSLDLVRDVIEWRAPEVNACFAGAPKKAFVRYRFEVGPPGNVVRLAFLDAQRTEAARSTCVGTALEGWRFPALVDGGTVVEWEFSAMSFDAGVFAEPEFLAPEQFPAAWVDAASRCYDATRPDETREGRLALDLTVGRAGAVVEASASLATPALGTELPACLARMARTWSWSAASAPRRVFTQWLFASTERRAKLLFLPTAPAKEIIAHQPKLFPAPAGLDKDVIMLELKRSSRFIRDCYEARLQGNRELGGKLAVAFVIGPQGNVQSSAAADDTVHDEPMTRCILEVVSRMKFPPPAGGGVVNVTFPWIFKSAGDE